MFFGMLERLPAHTIVLVASVLLAFGCGALSGLVVAFAHDAGAHPPVIVRGSGSVAAAVTLDGFRDGALRGRAAGVRIFAQGEAVDVAPDGSFAIVHPSFRIEEVSIPVPEGMAFVASKKGKKYYAVDSAAGERIAPQNRLYFRTEVAAKAAGFVR